MVTFFVVFVLSQLLKLFSLPGFGEIAPVTLSIHTNHIFEPVWVEIAKLFYLAVFSVIFYQLQLYFTPK